MTGLNKVGKVILDICESNLAISGFAIDIDDNILSSQDIGDKIYCVFINYGELSYKYKTPTKLTYILLSDDDNDSDGDDYYDYSSNIESDEYNFDDESTNVLDYFLEDFIL